MFALVRCPRTFRLSGRGRAISSQRQIEHFQSHLLKHKQLSDDKKELILTILSSTATKREVRTYLSKYPLLKENDIYLNKNEVVNKQNPPAANSNKKYQKLIDNLLAKYSGAERIDLNSAIASPGVAPVGKREVQLSDTLRLAVIRISDFNTLTMETAKGIGLTLQKMIQLGASPVIVLDHGGQHSPSADAKLLAIRAMVDQARSLIQGLQSDTSLEFRAIRDLFEYDADTDSYDLAVPEVLTIPLLQGIIPVICPVAVNAQTSEELVMSSFDAIESITINLASLNDNFRSQNGSTEDLLTIEKIIYLDENGGIPSLERFQSSHVYINLLQEYQDIVSELYIGHLRPAQRDAHLENLKEMNALMTLLPEATGLITTPAIATLKHQKRTTNPIIYNILTDRPVISSSLPVNLKKTPQLNTTIIRKGIPVYIHLAEDQPDGKGISLLEFEKQGILDLKKLKYLIDDSFGRQLDLDHYLNRIDGRVAALIMAGDYKGCAIVTWEQVQEEDGSIRVVPYLDKFAVLRKLQGVPGMADVVFKSLLLNFPKELLWRSRINNPVNKWYFDRSLSNYCIPGSQWRLFFSGTKKRDLKDLQAYVKVCSSIEPSFRS